MLRARAKANLSLRICGKLPSGYHFLQSVVCPLSLADSVRIELHKGSSDIECETRCSPALKRHFDSCSALDPAVAERVHSLSSAKNLAAKAARLMSDELHLPFGARIEVEKAIPLEAGLGGGSADAAAVIVGINELLDLGLPPARLFELGAKVGSDVPALIADSLVLMTGRGEELSAVEGPENWTAGIELLVIKPLQSVSTASAYSMFDCRTSISERNIHEFGPFSESALSMLREQSLRLVTSDSADDEADKQLTLLTREGISGGPILGSRSRALPRFVNDFQSVILGHYAEIRAASEQLTVAGADQVLLAGSGSALIGVFGCDAENVSTEEREANDAAKASVIADALQRGWFVSESRFEP